MKKFLMVMFLGTLVAFAGLAFGQCPGGTCCYGGRCARSTYYYPTYGGWFYYERPAVPQAPTPVTAEEEKQLEEATEEKTEETVSEEKPVPTFREIALERINAFRARAGLPALELDEGLCQACDRHCWTMASRGFGHDPAGGMEVIAMGVGSPEGAVAMWINSAPHSAILRARAVKIGVGRWGYFWTVRIR